MLKVKLTQACTDTSLPILYRDLLLDGANGGVLSLYDIANTYSYDQSTSPSNSKVVKNINESGNDGSLVIQSGQSLSVSGNGLVFDAVTSANNYVNGNSAPLANIWANANQYFLYVMYCKLPSSANWNTSGSLETMMQFASQSADYRTVADLLLIAQQSSGQILSFRRQTAIGSADTIGLTPNALDYGNFVQLAFWRNASGQAARLKSANGTVIATNTVNSNNSANFSTSTQKVGHVGELLGSANSVKWRYYRSFLENLNTSGRDPATVADADYARTVARGVFS